MSVPILRWDKDPDEKIDFKVDWATNVFVAGEEIDTSTWIVPDGVTKFSDSNTVGTTTIVLTGGTLKRKYKIVNRVVTTGDRIYDQTAILTIKEH